MYYQKITQNILRELIKNEKIKISEKKLSRGLQALVIGLWLDQLEDPDTFSKKEAKEICYNYINQVWYSLTCKPNCTPLVLCMEAQS